MPERRRIDLGAGAGDINVSAKLLYQTIGYRWASNLRDYDSFETNRFVGFFEDNADIATVVLAEDTN